MNLLNLLMFPSRRPRQRAHEDDNDYRIMVKRIQITSNRRNVDIQRCVAEAEFAAKIRGEKFNISNYLCGLIRLGVAALVREHPEAATPSMLQIAKEFDPSIKVPEVHEIRPVSDPTIPSIIDYYEKGISGRNLHNAYLDGLISKKDLIDIYGSVCAVRAEILSEPVLDRIKDEEMAKRPDLMDLERDNYQAKLERLERDKMDLTRSSIIGPVANADEYSQST